eukprot:CAMPEP_0205800452 /NCGR_PEP_ID=MMETSP0205-20121125/2104_1 /ASSEMBLY_ACC=CAM_ASM_000278 /TAXON_ID=36767 /ORGANISM="Euplotes focardii, Strain TN1" /LENGTH=156 /DNA_ID=CAMNT_0053063541 /DNA_START=233 /DNA_END=700 /DNA_ORIENTATION=+
MLKEALDTACDIPMNILDHVEEYKKKFPIFDTSLLDKYSDPAHFFLKDMNLDFAKEILSVKTPDAIDPMGSNAFELLLETINDNYPKKTEGKKSILARVSKAKEYIKEFVEKTDLEKDSKIILVGHSYYFKMWTGKWERDLSYYEEDIPEPSEALW